MDVLIAMATTVAYAYSVCFKCMCLCSLYTECLIAGVCVMFSY